MRRPPSPSSPRALRRVLLLLPLLPLMLGAAALQRGTIAEALATIRAGDLHARISFLADDLLEGRSPGSRGGAIASRYVASEMQRIGLRPAAAGYLQPVTLVGSTVDVSRAHLRAGVTADNPAVTFDLEEDALIWRGGEDAPARVDAPLVFAGYGVVAAEFGWDDFKGVDVRGKVLLVLVNDPPAPPSDPERFGGRTLTYYGRWAYKLEEARRRGAAGVLLVHTPAMAGYDWQVVRSSFAGERFSLPRDSAAPPSLALEGWLTGAAARRLLRVAELDMAELFVRAARRDFRPVDTGLRVQAALPGRLRRLRSSNVVGLLPGSDPARSAETVLYTAHWDHLGVGAPVGGDSVYNGAYDNASGVALMLEVAEAFATLQPPPPRTILFMATTAEEAGMLGAEHYVRRPLRPLARTVAVLNLDGANIWGETDDILVLGADLSTLGETAAVRAREQRLRLAFDAAPELGLYFRSDNFPFARAGVPAITIGHGMSFRGRPGGWGEAQLLRYDSLAYHQPGDRYAADWDLRGAVQQGRVAFMVGWDAASMAELPVWSEGVPFRRPGR